MGYLMPKFDSFVNDCNKYIFNVPLNFLFVYNHLFKWNYIQLYSYLIQVIYTVAKFWVFLRLIIHTQLWFQVTIPI